MESNVEKYCRRSFDCCLQNVNNHTKGKRFPHCVLCVTADQ